MTKILKLEKKLKVTNTQAMHRVLCKLEVKDKAAHYRPRRSEVTGALVNGGVVVRSHYRLAALQQLRTTRFPSVE